MAVLYPKMLSQMTTLVSGRPIITPFLRMTGVDSFVILREAKDPVWIRTVLLFTGFFTADAVQNDRFMGIDHPGFFF